MAGNATFFGTLCSEFCCTLLRHIDRPRRQKEINKQRRKSQRGKVAVASLSTKANFHGPISTPAGHRKSAPRGHFITGRTLLCSRSYRLPYLVLKKCYSSFGDRRGSTVVPWGAAQKCGRQTSRIPLDWQLLIKPLWVQVEQ